MIIVLLRKDRDTETLIKLHTQRHYFTRSVLNYRTKSSRHSTSRLWDIDRFIAVRLKRGYKIVARLHSEQ